MESEKVPERLRASRLLITGILMVLGLSCAVQVPPSGGPPDTIPPQIIASDPAPGTLHFRGSRFTLRFSEYVDRRSVEESIFISPSVGTLEFDWGSTDVDITFRDSLRPSTTYILTVGTDVIDKRNRNRMESDKAGLAHPHKAKLAYGYPERGTPKTPLNRRFIQLEPSTSNP